MYKLQNTEANDFRITYSTVNDPLINGGFKPYVNLGSPTTQPNSEGWYEGVYIIAKNQAAAQASGADTVDAAAFTQYFSLRFDTTNLTGSTEWDWSTWSWKTIEEIVWLDDISITVR
jgi:hypothetical protein